MTQLDCTQMQCSLQAVSRSCISQAGPNTPMTKWGAGLNYDRNIVQFYGVCLQEGSQPMLICEVKFLPALRLC